MHTAVQIHSLIELSSMLNEHWGKNQPSISCEIQTAGNENYLIIHTSPNYIIDYEKLAAFNSASKLEFMNDAQWPHALVISNQEFQWHGYQKTFDFLRTIDFTGIYEPKTTAMQDTSVELKTDTTIIIPPCLPPKKQNYAERVLHKDNKKIPLSEALLATIKRKPHKVVAQGSKTNWLNALDGREWHHYPRTEHEIGVYATPLLPGDTKRSITRIHTHDTFSFKVILDEDVLDRQGKPEITRIRIPKGSLRSINGTMYYCLPELEIDNLHDTIALSYPHASVSGRRMEALKKKANKNPDPRDQIEL